jgi:LDH2 family malate/lactate/ureidoglycolate dehydrogenase
MSTDVCVIGDQRLVGLADGLLRRAGADAEAARLVAESLVEANLRGVDSHGVMRIPGYLELIRQGRIRPSARPTLVHDTGGTITMDGNLAFGQLVARDATAAAVLKARTHGVAAATISGVEHVGRLGEFAEQATSADCIAFLFVNSGPPGGLVAPFGGRSRLLGTNPIAFGIPAGERPPIISDFSTSSATDGKIRLLLEAKAQLPEGWLVDALGRASVDPADLYHGGALLPAAGHKGFALGLLVEILGGVLAGAGCASTGGYPGNGVAIIVVDPSAFVAGGAFGPLVDQVIGSVEASSPGEGFDRVVVPGTPERDTRVIRRDSGVPLALETWRTLVSEARRCGIDVDGLLGQEPQPHAT